MTITSLTKFGIALPPGSDPNALADLWVVALADVSLPDAAAAALSWAAESKWWPTPAELRARLPRRSLAELSGQGSWEVLRLGLRRHGFYDPPRSLGGSGWDWEADSKRIAAAVQALGGWPAVCGWLEADLPHHQRRWVEAWDSQAKQVADDATGRRALEFVGRGGLKLIKGGAE